MAQTVVYQGYTIRSAPQFKADWLKWQVHIVISLHDHWGIQTREFSSNVLYATLQDADRQGIAFGRRLIDGKVDGRSVAIKKRADRRATPRFPVQFRTMWFSFPRVEERGIMRDLSSGGCRIESPVSVQHGVALELRVEIPDWDRPLKMNSATVQWVSGQLFGVAFARMRENERERLAAVIGRLSNSSLC